MVRPTPEGSVLDRAVRSVAPLAERVHLVVACGERHRLVAPTVRHLGALLADAEEGPQAILPELELAHHVVGRIVPREGERRRLGEVSRDGALVENEVSLTCVQLHGYWFLSEWFESREMKSTDG